MHANKGNARLGSRETFACPETPALAPVSEAEETADSAPWAVTHPAGKVVLGTQSTRNSSLSLLNSKWHANPSQSLQIP